MCITMFNPSRPCCRPVTRYTFGYEGLNPDFICTPTSPSGRAPQFPAKPYLANLAGYTSAGAPREDRIGLLSQCRVLVGRQSSNGTSIGPGWDDLSFTYAHWSAIKDWVTEGGRYIQMAGSNHRLYTEDVEDIPGIGEVSYFQYVNELLSFLGTDISYTQDPFSFFGFSCPNVANPAVATSYPGVINSSVPVMENVDYLWMSGATHILGGQEWLLKNSSYQIAVISKVGKGYVIAIGSENVSTSCVTFWQDNPLAERANYQFFDNIAVKNELMSTP